VASLVSFGIFLYALAKKWFYIIVIKWIGQNFRIITWNTNPWIVIKLRCKFKHNNNPITRVRLSTKSMDTINWRHNWDVNQCTVKNLGKRQPSKRNLIICKWN
jgi:hypothetical protein